jgi:RHS repeat-associated protein
LTNGVEASFRSLVWRDNSICEERDAAGAVVKRFYEQGMKVESGPTTGSFFYTRDHLGTICELTDSSGNVRSRYAYDPFGRRTRLSGDVEADFGFGRMFWSAEARLAITRFRAYDVDLGRWLSRDPLRNAEIQEGPNLYAYVRNSPVNATDPLGLCCKQEKVLLEDLVQAFENFKELLDEQYGKCLANSSNTKSDCEFIVFTGRAAGRELERDIKEAARDYVECMMKGCDEKPCPQPGAPPVGPPPIPVLPKCTGDDDGLCDD